METQRLENVYIRGNKGPLVLWPVGKFNDVSKLLDETISFDGILVIVQEDNWNDSFSPWTFDYEDMHFGGRAKETLVRYQKLLEELKQVYEIEKVYLCGYSLAGLFALWCAVNWKELDGVICCSGTLWFDGFDRYMQEQEIDMPVYLSLGGKEEKVKHLLMKTIGVKTREMSQYLKKQGIKTTLVMHKGGHFGNEIKRISQGIIWMMQNQ